MNNVVVSKFHEKNDSVVCLEIECVLHALQGEIWIVGIFHYQKGCLSEIISCHPLGRWGQLNMNSCRASNDKDGNVPISAIRHKLREIWLSA